MTREDNVVRFSRMRSGINMHTIACYSVLRSMQPVIVLLLQQSVYLSPFSCMVLQLRCCKFPIHYGPSSPHRVCPFPSCVRALQVIFCPQCRELIFPCCATYLREFPSSSTAAIARGPFTRVCNTSTRYGPSRSLLHPSHTFVPSTVFQSAVS